MSKKYKHIDMILQTEKSFIEKVEDENGQVFCRKIAKKGNGQSYQTLKFAYEQVGLLKKSKVPMPEIHEIAYFPEKKEVEIIMEFLDGYENITDLRDEIHPKKRKELLVRMIEIMYMVWKLGLHVVDFGSSNFMYNPKTDSLKIIDFDTLTNSPIHAGTADNTKCHQYFYFMLYWYYTFLWAIEK